MARDRLAQRSTVLRHVPVAISMLALVQGAISTKADAHALPQQIAITVAEPAGFATLSDPQTVVADIYYGGSKVGSAELVFKPGSLTFVDPAKVVAMLPLLTAPQEIENAIAQKDLPSNSRLVCTPGAPRDRCGRLQPDVAGIIFDEAHFRVDVFVNPALLARADSTKRYLPTPQAGLSLVNSIGGVISGSSQGNEFYNVQNRLILGDADRRLRADIAYATKFGLQADRLALEMDKPGWRYTAGAFWAPGTDLIGRRKIFGAGIETQFDTRMDRDALRGNALAVVLSQRSRVDILRDGRVIGSGIYEAGNQLLDTNNLPDGTYEVVLRIEEASGAQRSERRFFSKNPLIPAAGETTMAAYGGVLSKDREGDFLNPTDTPFVQAGIARRIGEHFAVDATVMATDASAMLELGGYYVGSWAQIRLAGIGSSDELYGGLVRVASSGDTAFNFNFDLRSIHIKDGAGPDQRQPQPTPLPFPNRDPLSLSVSDITFTQVYGNLSYSMHNAHFSVVGSLRKSQGALETQYSVGPAFRWDVLVRGPMRLTAQGDVAFTNQGKAAFVGLTFQMFAGRTAVNASLGGRASDLEGDGRKHTGLVGAIHASRQENLAGGDLNFGGGYEHNLQYDVVGGDVDYRGDAARLNGALTHNFGQGSSQTQYSAGFETLVAARGGTLSLDGRRQTDSVLMVDVDGASPGEKFEVLVNDAPVAQLQGGGTASVALNAYRQYDVRIRQVGGELVRFDADARRVSLYPGNVARLEWSAMPVVTIFGRIVDVEGTSIPNAYIATQGGIGMTDDNGYFAIEATPNARIHVALPAGRTCEIVLPDVTAKDGFAQIGTLRCPEFGNEGRIASYDPSKGTGE